MPSYKREKVALSQARAQMQACQRVAFTYRRVYDSLVDGFAKADECLASGAISPGYAQDIEASLQTIQTQVSSAQPSQVEDLVGQAWAIRNRLLNCLHAQQNLDRGFLSNEEAWAAYLKEYGIDASEVKKL